MVEKPIQIFPGNSRRRNNNNRLVLFMIFISIFTATLNFLRVANSEITEAASLDHFDPGNIITDYNMSRYNSMTEAEIQNFLKSKNKCNDTRTYLAEQYSSYTYHIENGHFVCMADEKFDTATGEPATKDSKSTETAAHIIYTVAQEYKINPQVLIVLLQKEQGLITDTWPNYRQYRAATGYGCPDTAACDTKYYGLRNQISNAAKLFRTVLDGGWTNYPLGKNYIQYNPNADCKGTEVNIKNLATSSLYRYTPYQPNAAALKAGYGQGDSCSAYGNRNFYLYFSDWFSDPTDDSTASPLGVSAEDDEVFINKGKDGKEYKTTKEINDYWQKSGAEKSSLGYPTENYGYDSKIGMYWQGFQHGYVVGSDNTGYFESAGMIREFWAKSGYQDGKFGLPTGSISFDSKTGMYWQEYQNGFIVGSDKTGWHESSGKIREYWASTGFQGGSLGMPIDEIGYDAKSGMSWQEYQNGFIVGSEKTGWHTSAGTIRDYWGKNGFQNGRFGMPTGEIDYDIKEMIFSQKYQNRTIYYDVKLNRSFDR